MSASTQWQLELDSAWRYEQVLVPTILGPAAQALVEWADLHPGETVLDVGCGTGAAARRAAEIVGSTGRVWGVDVNGSMLGVAKLLPAAAGATIEWVEESAYQLPLDNSSVDVALCAQTLQFLADRPRALAEVRRVLKPGGRAVFSLWCELPDNPYFHALVIAIEQHIGTQTAAGLKAAFSLSDAAEIRSLLVEAGFAHLRLSVLQLDLELPRLREFVPRHIRATPMSADFSASGQSVQQAVIQEVIARLERYENGAGPRLPFRTHLVTARKATIDHAA